MKREFIDKIQEEASERGFAMKLSGGFMRERRVHVSELGGIAITGVAFETLNLEILGRIFYSF